MQFGAQLGNYGTQWPDIATTVHALESGRWNSVWFSDHFMHRVDRKLPMDQRWRVGL